MDSPQLSPRQIAVLREVSAGLTTQAAARQLGIAPDTVKEHLANAYRRLGARNGPHAVALGYEFGLLP